MTNHGETTGSPENGKAAEHGGHDGHEFGDEASGCFNSGCFNDERPGHPDPTAALSDVRPGHVDCTAYDSHGPQHQVTLRTPAELADALPYLLGYRPED